MTKRSGLNPNIPDIEPDYVDIESPPSKPPDSNKPSPATSIGADKKVVAAPTHFLNAEILPAATPSEHNAGKEPPLDPTISPPPAPTPREVEDSIPDSTGIAKELITIDSNTGTEEMEPSVAGRSDKANHGAETSETNGHRAHECIPNVPDSTPDIVSGTEEAVAAKLPGTVADDAPEPTVNNSWLRWDLVVTVLIISIFGLLVFSQAISALALAATLPVWAQYLLLIPLGVCCLAVLFVCANVVIAWFRLRRVRQIDLEALEELRRRAKTRKDAVDHFQAARTELQNYLERYPLDADGARRLQAAGVSAATCEKLVRDRDYLLGKTTDSLSWLGEFRDQFQSTLEQSARARIKYWSLVAAGCVIASPIPLLDAALILGVASKMIKDLCFIYNVRSGRSTAFVILNRAIITAFIAGVAEDAAAMATDAASDELAGIFGESAIGAFGAGMARFIAPKLGEGAINAFFINRLGKATLRLLQPLKPR